MSFVATFLCPHQHGTFSRRFIGNDKFRLRVKFLLINHVLLLHFIYMIRMHFSDVVNSGGVMQWSCSLSDGHLYRSRLSTPVRVLMVSTLINFVFHNILLIDVSLTHIHLQVVVFYRENYITDLRLTFLQRVSVACYAERCISYSKSVRPSVRPSVTRWHWVKTTQATIMRSSLEDSPMILVSSTLNFTAKFQREHGERRHRMREG